MKFLISFEFIDFSFYLKEHFQCSNWISIFLYIFWVKNCCVVMHEYLRENVVQEEFRKVNSIGGIGNFIDKWNNWIFNRIVVIVQILYLIKSLAFSFIFTFLSLNFLSNQGKWDFYVIKVFAEVRMSFVFIPALLFFVYLE